MIQYGYVVDQLEDSAIRVIVMGSNVCVWSREYVYDSVSNGRFTMGDQEPSFRPAG